MIDYIKVLFMVYILEPFYYWRAKHYYTQRRRSAARMTFYISKFDSCDKSITYLIDKMYEEDKLYEQKTEN